MKLSSKVLSLISFALGLGFLFAPLAYVSAAASVSIQSLSPGTTLLPGNEVYFTVVGAGYGSALTYSVADNLSGSTVSNNDFNNAGVFTWIPTLADAGTHTLTITVADQSGNTASVTQQITVQGPPTVSIQSLSPSSSVIVGQAVSFTAAASNFINPVYSVTDAFYGSTVNSSSITSAGTFSWTPSAANDVGTHSITVNVTDSSGHSASATQSITVGAGASIAIQTIVPGTTVAPSQTLTFAAVPTLLTSPSYTVTDSFPGSSVSNGAITSSGVFTWTPISADAGTHVITVYATDPYGHSANSAVTIQVQGVGISLSAPSPSAVIAIDSRATFQVSVYGFINPSFGVSDSLAGTTVSTSSINSSGTFSWIPTAADVGTHVITVTATDSSGHSASAQVTIAAVPASSAASAAASTTTSAAAQLQAQIQAATAALAAAQAAQQAGGSSSASAHVFNASLHSGITSDEVVALQKVLAAQGFLSAAATGYYGPATEKAVRAFQAAHGLAQLGIVGPGTRDALNALSGSSAASAAASSAAASASSGASASDGYQFSTYLVVGSAGKAVTELQTRLTAEGLYSGPITGRFGALTQAAVMAYQAKHGLAKLGVVGPGTRAMLNK